MKVSAILSSAAAFALVAGAPAYAKSKHADESAPASAPATNDSSAPAPASAGTTPSTTAPATDAATSSAATGAPGTANTAAATSGATTGSKVAVGALVKDTSGQPVGKIEAVEGDVATISTATSQSKVRIPVSSFGSDANGPVLAMTASQLDQAAKAAQSSQPASN